VPAPPRRADKGEFAQLSKLLIKKFPKVGARGCAGCRVVASVILDADSLRESGMEWVGDRAKPGTGRAATLCDWCHGCTVVRLYSCVTVVQLCHGCTVVRLCGCAVVLIHFTPDPRTGSVPLLLKRPAPSLTALEPSPGMA
jgi:hypothetical protein